MLFLFFIFMIILLFYIVYFVFNISDTTSYMLNDFNVWFKVFLSYKDYIANAIINNKSLDAKLFDPSVLVTINKISSSFPIASNKVGFLDFCIHFLDKDSYLFIPNPAFMIDVDSSIVITKFLVVYMEGYIFKNNFIFYFLKGLFSCFLLRNISYYLFKVNEDSFNKMYTDCKMLQTLVNYVKRSRVFIFFIVFYRFFFFKDFSISFLYHRRYYYIISWVKYFILCYIEFFIGLVVFSFYIIYLFYSLNYCIMASVLSCIFTKSGFICLVLLLLLICILMLYFIFLYFILLLYSLKIVKPLSTLRKIFKRL